MFLALSLEEEGSRPFGPASQRLLRDGPQLGVPTSQQFRLFPPCMEGPLEAGPQGWAFGFRVWLKVPGLSVPLWYLSVDPRRNSWGWLPFTMGLDHITCVSTRGQRGLDPRTTASVSWPWPE